MKRFWEWLLPKGDASRKADESIRIVQTLNPERNRIIPEKVNTMFVAGHLSALFAGDITPQGVDFAVRVKAMTEEPKTLNIDEALVFCSFLLSHQLQIAKWIQANPENSNIIILSSMGDQAFLEVARNAKITVVKKNLLGHLNAKAVIKSLKIL